MACQQGRDLWLIREGPTALARITAASIELFAEQGYHGTSIRDIASRAGVSTAVIYHHRRSKLEILLDLMERGQRLLDLVTDRVVEGVDDPLEQLVQVMHAHVLVSAVNQRTSLVIDTEVSRLPEADRGSVVAARDAYERRLGRLLVAAADTGAIQVANPALARIALLQLLSSVAVWYSPDGELELGEVARELLRLALGMLGVHDPSTVEPLLAGLPSLLEQLALLDDAVREVWSAPQPLVT